MKKLFQEIQAYLGYSLLAMGLLLAANTVLELIQLNVIAGILGVIGITLASFVCLVSLSMMQHRSRMDIFVRKYIAPSLVDSFHRLLCRFAHAFHGPGK